MERRIRDYVIGACLPRLLVAERVIEDPRTWHLFDTGWGFGPLCRSGRRSQLVLRSPLNCIPVIRNAF